ncbi:MAG: zinc ribbon domain-containing protein [Pseudomonadota bacterium]
MIFDTRLPASGTLQLQQCVACRHVNYPPRDLCAACLTDTLQWQAVDDGGTVLSQSHLHYSLEPGYTERLPLAIVSIKLDCGPIALAHAAPGCGAGSRVRVKIVRDADHNHLLAAFVPQTKTDREREAWLSAMGFQEIRS